MSFQSALLLMFVCGTVAGQTLTDKGTVTVLLEGDGAAPGAVLRAAEHEVESAVAPSGISVNWVFKQEGRSPVVDSRLAILRLQGQCYPLRPSASRRLTAEGDAESLGQTQVADGKVLPIANIFCDALRNLVSRDLWAIPVSEHEELMGRALGRVMAHELYHILMRTTKHGHSGLSRPVQSSAELLSARDSFSRQDERKIAESYGADWERIPADSGR